MKEHLGYIRNKKTSEPTGQHFNLPGHDISMLRASVFKVCKSQSRVYREHREEHFIQAFQTKLRIESNSLARCTSNILLIKFICSIMLLLFSLFCFLSSLAECHESFCKIYFFYLADLPWAQPGTASNIEKLCSSSKQASQKVLKECKLKNPPPPPVYKNSTF